MVVFREHQWLRISICVGVGGSLAISLRYINQLLLSNSRKEKEN